MTAQAFSSRASFSATASRTNFDRPYVPTRASMRSMSSGGNRTGTRIRSSGGRPMRAAVADWFVGRNKTAPFSLALVNGPVYINGTLYGGKPVGIKISELVEIAHLTSDEIVGWEAQIAVGFKRPAIWPDHFRGTRVDAFERGAELARRFLAMRNGYGTARRTVRNRDFKETGATSCTILASRMTAADLHAEQIETFREVVRMRDRVLASMEGR